MALLQEWPRVLLSGMKESIFTRWLKPKPRAGKDGPLTADDIRRKLSTYQKQEGPAVFGGAQLYRVEELEEQDKVPPLSTPSGR